RTTRQGRSLAIGGAIVAAAGARVAGFGVSALAARSAWAIPLIYLVPLAAIGLAMLSAVRPGWSQRLRDMIPGRQQPQAATA
ncbi:MAG: hypothetical protein AB7J19_01170, partial [Beijerinckiaceae bacterium]